MKGCVKLFRRAPDVPHSGPCVAAGCVGVVEVELLGKAGSVAGSAEEFSVQGIDVVPNSPHVGLFCCRRTGQIAV